MLSLLTFIRHISFCVSISISVSRYEVSNEEYLKFTDSTMYLTDSEVYGWSFVFDSAGEKAKAYCRCHFLSFFTFFF